MIQGIASRLAFYRGSTKLWYTQQAVATFGSSWILRWPVLTRDHLGRGDPKAILVHDLLQLHCIIIITHTHELPHPHRQRGLGGPFVCVPFGVPVCGTSFPEASPRVMAQRVIYSTNHGRVRRLEYASHIVVIRFNTRQANGGQRTVRGAQATGCCVPCRFCRDCGCSLEAHTTRFIISAVGLWVDKRRKRWPSTMQQVGKLLGGWDGVMGTKQAGCSMPHSGECDYFDVVAVPWC